LGNKRQGNRKRETQPLRYAQEGEGIKIAQATQGGVIPSLGAKTRGIPIIKTTNKKRKVPIKE